MGDAAALFFAVATVAAVAPFFFLQQSGRKRRYEEAARALGLEVRTGIFRDLFELRGSIRGVTLLVEYKHHRNGNFTRFSLQDRRIPTELQLTKQRGGGWRSLLSGPQEDLLTGDEVFDQEIVVGGRARDVLACLDAEARQLVLEAFATGSTQIVGGTVVREITLRELRGKDPDLVDHSRRLLALCESLRPERDRVAALARNAIEDPVEGVRLRNLAVLQSDLPNHDETARASRQAMASGDPELRLRGAGHLGEEGFTALVELATPNPAAWAIPQPIPLPGSPPHVQVAALRRLLHHFAGGRLESILRRQIRGGRGRPRSLAIRGAAQHDLTALLPDLYLLLASDAEHDRDALTGGALADALTRLDGVVAEPHLVGLLSHAEESVRDRAVRGLAACGTVRSIPALREAADGSLEYRRLVEQAVAAIQGRLEGAAAGQLSLAEARGERGALSLAPAGRQGAVSLTDEEAP